MSRLPSGFGCGRAHLRSASLNLRERQSSTDRGQTRLSAERRPLFRTSLGQAIFPVLRKAMVSGPYCPGTSRRGWSRPTARWPQCPISSGCVSARPVLERLSIPHVRNLRQSGRPCQGTVRFRTSPSSHRTRLFMTDPPPGSSSVQKGLLHIRSAARLDPDSCRARR